MKTKEYIYERINPNQGTGCWEWNLSTNPQTGYGQVGFYPYVAYKLAFLIWNEREPEGIIRHMCHNKLCCNPSHLREGTYKDNYWDSIGKHRSGCRSRRKVWSVAGVRYDTCRDAVEATGISMAAIQKYTREGVFDVESYRKNCRIAGWAPKV